MKRTSAVIHRRYSDKADRPDLRELAKCNNINGPICSLERLTSDDKSVTCRSCLRIMEGRAISRKAFGDAALRKISRELGSASAPSYADLQAMLEDARKTALRALGEPHGAIAYEILATLGIGRVEAEKHRRFLRSTAEEKGRCDSIAIPKNLPPMHDADQILLRQIETFLAKTPPSTPETRTLLFDVRWRLKNSNGRKYV